MSTNATANISALQEDAPANQLPELQSSFEATQHSKVVAQESSFKKIIDTKPFYRYANDGLYGLL